MTRDITPRQLHSLNGKRALRLLHRNGVSPNTALAVNLKKRQATIFCLDNYGSRYFAQNNEIATRKVKLHRG